jgi:hypothetical protein
VPKLLWDLREKSPAHLSATGVPTQIGKPIPYDRIRSGALLRAPVRLSVRCRRALKTGHFEIGIAHRAAAAAQVRDEPAQREPATFHFTLAVNGWSARKIARELGIHREPVGRYLRPAETVSKPAIVPAGSKSGRSSQCVPLAAVINQGVLAGLSAQRIYQDMVAGHAFSGSYDAVKRLVRRLAHKVDPPFPRMQCAPGHEL